MAEITQQEVTGQEEDILIGRLPMGSPGRKSSGWYGMVAMIATEASLFVYLLFSYYYFWVWSGGSFLPYHRPELSLAGPDTIVLILSSVAVWWGERGIKRNRPWQLSVGLGIGIVLGVIFLVVQYLEWRSKTFRPDTTPFGSLYFTTTGFHMAHVAFGVLILLALFVWSLMRLFDIERHAPVTIGTMYWHFVDVVWLFIFFSYYLAPYLS